MKRLVWLVLAMSTFGSAGCVSDPYGYRSLSLTESVAVIEARQREATSISAECIVRVADGGGRRATLDGVVVSQPQSFRLQAWRGPRTLLDIVIREDGIWFAGEMAANLDESGMDEMPASIAPMIWQSLVAFQPATQSGAWRVRNAGELSWVGAIDGIGDVEVRIDRSLLIPTAWW